MAASLCGIAATLLWPDPAQAIIISASQNALTANLGHNGADPWRGVGMVGAGPMNMRNYFCTGTLLDTPPNVPKRWILTAAHCTYDNAFDIHPGQRNPGGFTPPSLPPRLPYPYPRPRMPQAPPAQNPFQNAFGPLDMWFHLPMENAAAHYQSVAIHRHPNWLAGDDTYDVALIQLNMAVPSTAWKINAGQIGDERGQPTSVPWGHKVGYGAGGDGRNGETSGYGIKREGFNEVNGFLGANNQMLEFDFDDHLTTPLNPLFPSRGGFWVAGPEEANTTHGDSGGPMFMHDGTDWRIVGVTRQGDGQGMGAGAAVGGVGFVEKSNDVRVQSVAGWINNTIPEPNTLALLLCGLASALRRPGRRVIAGVFRRRDWSRDARPQAAPPEVRSGGRLASARPQADG